MTVQLVRRIEVPAKDIKWSGGGDLVAIIGESSFYVLRYSREEVDAAMEAKTELDEDGIEEAFELQTETSEAVRTGEWSLQKILSALQCPQDQYSLASGAALSVFHKVTEDPPVQALGLRGGLCFHRAKWSPIGGP